MLKGSSHSGRHVSAAVREFVLAAQLVDPITKGTIGGVAVVVGGETGEVGVDLLNGGVV